MGGLEKAGTTEGDPRLMFTPRIILYYYTIMLIYYCNLRSRHSTQDKETFSERDLCDSAVAASSIRSVMLGAWKCGD